MIEWWPCFSESRSRLFVALTLLPASVLFETGSPVRLGSNQRLETLLLECILQGGVFLVRFKFEHSLLVPTTCDVFEIA